MENYTLSLALFDYLPVIAAGFGLYLICKYCGGIANYSGAWVVIIPMIALIGGVLKASWKLIYALDGSNYGWMSDQLFFFLAPAYIFMAFFVFAALRAGKRGADLSHGWWPVPLVIVLAVLAAAFYLKFDTSGRLWALLLLAALSIANLVFLLTLIGHSWRRRNWVAVGAFVLNIGLSYTLVGLARLEQTAELQWTEEILNLANNSLLAVGAWSLIRGSVSNE